MGIADPGAEVVAYLVSASSSAPDVSDASADASSDVVFDVWRNVDPTADTFVESYLDATLDSSADGTQTLHLWFRDSSGKLSDRGSDSIVLYSSAGRVRDTGQTACFSATGTLDPRPAAGNAFFGQDAQYDGLLSTYTAGAGLRAGTVRDNVTGLVWRRVLDSAADGARTFAQLTALCDALDLGGYDDWRVPTARETVNLLGYGLSRILPDLFVGDSLIFWTRTPLATNPSNQTWVLQETFSLVYSNLNEAGTNTTNMCLRGVSRLPFDYEFTARGTGTADTTDDTVVESRTGLVWDRRGTPTKRNWQNALAHCADSTHDGRTDWRLPSLNELLTLIDYDATTGARIDPAFDDVSADNHWTSTTRFNRAVLVYGIDFSFGDYSERQKSRDHSVRCVRND